MENAESDGGGEMTPVVDLFGRPVVALRDRRGRPSFAKSVENQDFVAVRAAAGWSPKMIAEAIKCDLKTLTKHFSQELSDGALYVEGIMLDVLFSRVKTGHVPSIRRLQDRLDRNAPAAPRAKGGQLADVPRSEKLGKKEQAKVDAQAVPDEWGDVFAERDKRH